MRINPLHGEVMPGSFQSILLLLIALYYVTRCESEVINSVKLFGIRGGSIDSSHGSNNNNDLHAFSELDSKTAVLSNNNDEEEVWRSRLPTQLQQRRGSLHRILIPSSNNDNTIFHVKNDMGKNIHCELYLLGTAHVSKDSCEDAKLLMEHIKPDVLFVELCGHRTAILEDDDDDHNSNGNHKMTAMNQNSNSSNTIDNTSKEKNTNNEKKSISQMTKEIMMNNPGMSRAAALSSVLLSKVQGDYADKLGVNIGGEFKEAFKVAKIQQKEYVQIVEKIRAGIPIMADTSNENGMIHGCAVVLGDRPVRLTLLRTWESLNFFGKIKLVCGLLWSSLKQPDEKELKEWIESIMNDPTNDLLTKSIEELSLHFPSVKETIIAERDLYMACKLIQTARVLSGASAQDGNVRRIVAIVGAGHCPGIRKLLEPDSRLCGPNKIEEALKTVVETKKHKLDESPEMSSLINEVESIEIV